MESVAIICRCENITTKDVDKALKEGFTDLESLKRRLRIGMGPCQGRYCIPLLIGYLKKKLGKDVEELMIPRVRAPLTPIPAHIFLGDKSEEK